MAVVCVCTAVDMARGTSSRAGVGGCCLLAWEDSKGASRPKDRPTAEAPTTVAVAQSCVTKNRSVTALRTGSSFYSALASAAVFARPRGIRDTARQQDARGQEEDEDEDE